MQASKDTIVQFRSKSCFFDYLSMEGMWLTSSTEIEFIVELYPRMC